MTIIVIYQKKKKKKVNDILFNKLSPLVSYIIILQPYSLCDLQFLLFHVNSDYELSKKIKYNNDEKDNATDTKTPSFNAQKIITNLSDYIVNTTHKNNISEIINEYTNYFENDEKLAYKVVWFIIISYHIETLIHDCKTDYANLNIENIKSYIQLFGIKQYKNKKTDFYKLRIEWIINLFNEDKNTALVLPNLFKYCHWLVMDNEKNDFLMNLYADDSSESDTEITS